MKIVWTRLAVVLAVVFFWVVIAYWAYAFVADIRWFPAGELSVGRVMVAILAPLGLAALSCLVVICGFLLGELIRWIGGN